MQIRRIHKNHNSKIVNMPRLVLQAMGAKAGDYLMFKEIKQTGVFIIAKIHEGDYTDGKHKSHSNKQDKGRRPRAKVR